MKGYVANIDAVTATNDNFRQVLYTAKNCQLVVMSLLPKEDIGQEVHDLDQFIKIESGRGIAILDGVEHSIAAGSAIVIPSGTKHNIINASDTEKMKIYSVYAPPNHADKTVHVTKMFAAAHEEHFDGRTSE